MDKVICPLCREVVGVHEGMIVYHGSRYHGRFVACDGSFENYLDATYPSNDDV